MTGFNKKIHIAGARGMVGQALVRRFQSLGFQNLLTPTRSELELSDFSQVNDFFDRHRPDWLIIAAAKVGGIHANSTFPFEFLTENLALQNNLFRAALKHKVKKILFLGSSCIYPKLASQPLQESALLTGALEPTNEAYALAKIAGI